MKLSNIRNHAVSAALVSALGLTMFAASPVAFADDHAKCQHRIEKSEAQLDKAIQRHGERSPQAEARRRDLNAERDKCWSAYHGWWDGHERRWHDARDWEGHQ